MLFISLFFILTFFPASFAALYQKQIEIGAAFFILTAFFLWIAALSRKKKYGLILTLNSGDRHMFVTSDHKTLSEVIQQLYTFMESDKDGTYLYTINNNSIKIHGDMTGGVAATGNKSSTINSNT